MWELEGVPSRWATPTIPRRDRRLLDRVRELSRCHCSGGRYRPVGPGDRQLCQRAPANEAEEQSRKRTGGAILGGGAVDNIGNKWMSHEEAVVATDIEAAKNREERDILYIVCPHINPDLGGPCRGLARPVATVGVVLAPRFRMVIFKIAEPKIKRWGTLTYCKAISNWVVEPSMYALRGTFRNYAHGKGVPPNDLIP